MATPSFVVKLSDLEHGPRRVTFEISEGWLRGALAESDAAPGGQAGTLSLELMKNERDVLVRGRCRVQVTVPCVVTLEPLTFDLEPEVLLVLEPSAEPAARGKKLKKTSEKAPADRVTAAKGRPRKGRGELEPELSDEDAARDTYSGEEIILDPFVREFILLEIPPYPRRSDLPSPEESISSAPLAGPTETSKPIDPRLKPLQGILERLRGQAEKE